MDKILIVTNNITDSKEGISGDIQGENSLVDMPDWVLDEVADDNSIKAISTLMVDLRTMGPGFMLKESDFRKSVFYGNEELTDEQAIDIEKLLLEHGIIVNLGDIIRDEHPDWSDKEVDEAVLKIFNGEK